MKQGFTLLEVLLVIGILVVLSVAGVASYRGLAKNIVLDTTVESAKSILKTAHSKAMLGEGGLRWGVRFVNTPTNDYYELFSTPSNYTDPQMSIEDSVYLSSGVVFTDPGEGTVKDIIFSKIAGTTTPASVVFSSEESTATLSINAFGALY